MKGNWHGRKPIRPHLGFIDLRNQYIPPRKPTITPKFAVGQTVMNTLTNSRGIIDDIRWMNFYPIADTEYYEYKLGYYWTKEDNLEV
jgi:hypothetical protein